MSDKSLGDRLRELREARSLSLREVASRADVNAGYLSQLERGDVSQPSPAILQKLSEGYGEPFVVLMRWANYLEEDPKGLSLNQTRALKYIGRDVSDEELKALKAVLEAIRSTRATFGLLSLDGPLSDEDLGMIRGHVVALLRRADAYGSIPTPLDQVMDVSRLVAAGEIELEPELKRSLRRRFGDLVDRAFEQLLGAIRFDSSEIYVKPDLFWLKQRFVKSHEIGHHALPWHRELYAFLDDKTRLKPEYHDLYERQANQAAIEFLAQGDRLRREADGSPISLAGAVDLSNRFEISRVATVRRVVEESRQEVAAVIAYRAFTQSTRLTPPHLYCSRSFESRFGWKATRRASPTISAQLRLVLEGKPLEPLSEADLRGRLFQIEPEALQTSRALLLLFRCSPVRTRVLSSIGLRR